MSNTEYVSEEEWKELTQKDRVPLDKQLNKWIVVKDACYSGGGYYRCPVCGYEYSWGAFFELDEYSYCPKCGALLNGKTEASDYISRQVAIEALDRAVCDYCVCPCDKPYSKECNAVDNYSAGIRVIEELPTADVVEVVRCRDCKKYDSHGHRCKWWNHGVSNIDWCSKAERRTDETD